MRVSDLTRPKLVTTTIDLGDGDSVNVVFDRNRVTPAWAAEANRRDEDQDALSLPKALEDVISEWDVTNDDGTQFLPTAANIAVFSYPVQRELLTQILSAAVPSDAEGKASASPQSIPSSGSTETLAVSQNGTVTSTLPVPSASPSQT